MKQTYHFKYTEKTKIISFLFLVFSLITSPAFSSNAVKPRGIDEMINDEFMPVADWWVNLVLSSLPICGHDIPIVLILLLTGASIFTIYFGFINIRRFPTAIKIVAGRYDHLDIADVPRAAKSKRKTNSKKTKGEINHFQALTTAVSGTVGLGNISMVAVAVAIGGPGATFWMIVGGLLAMTSKFVECTLAVKYRQMDNHGRIYGGPMYYLSKGLKDLGFKNFGKALAWVYAFICIGASFGGGNAFQSNQATSQLIKYFDLQGSAIGLVLGIIFAILVGLVIIGGIKRIANVTASVVPIMTVVYVVAAISIIIINSQIVDDAIAMILHDAFTPRSTITGGFMSVVIQGFRRAAFSNEAGAGSAAIAHAAVKTNYPVSEGLVGLLEPFIDTVVICTITAFIIIIYNTNDAFLYGQVVNNQVTIIETNEQIGGVNLTTRAFETLIPGSSIILLVAVTFFALSTMLSWSYYGLQSWNYIFGRSNLADFSFKIIFLLFTVLGASVTLDAVIKFSDAMILALVFPNMIGLLILFPQIKIALQEYLNKIAKPQKPL